MTSRIDDAEKKRLETLKKEKGFKSINETIKFLLDQRDDGGAPDGSDSDSEMDISDEQEAGKVPQLLSFELIEQEAKASKFFTGLSGRSLKWAVEALEKAVRSKSISWCFRVGAQGGPVCCASSEKCS